ncbi:hypothetical protein IEQ34_012609 [Dendrobium chrysotoxum]|uniref:TLC domain-containing protein n=1 Tax=Dendrobium chrysotoxum TaxID=161865 RepID=A0AAV7GP83_DENCH|nr:hypothetical protein IEQ34_012609 [Dendrobium chrysotoxum]
MMKFMVLILVTPPGKKKDRDKVVKKEIMMISTIWGHYKMLALATNANRDVNVKNVALYTNVIVKMGLFAIMLVSCLLASIVAVVMVAVVVVCQSRSFLNRDGWKFWFHGADSMAGFVYFWHLHVQNRKYPSVYEITGLISREFFKGYHSLSKPTKIEWNNRGFSTFHAILVAAISFYLLVLSDLFKERTAVGSIIDRKSLLSDSLCGISIGYFFTDLGMILWYFPALGGMEYVLHHVLSMYAILLSLISGQAQYYILMVLFSEITTPFVNLRWYLDAYGQKSSMLYICNGVALFLGWLAARILLFIFFFAHMYLHFDQVFSNSFGFCS